MIDSEKVIRAIECRLDENVSKYRHCLSCDYRHDLDHCVWTCQTDGILEDALALLKAQEPRVMTLEEVKALSTDEVVFFQPNSVNPVRPRIVACVSENNIAFSDGGCWMFDEYGNRFYLWTARPTDAQREATPWMKN